MREPKHAILMAPTALGWTWEVIDLDGATMHKGFASEQESAMQAAWRAARASAEPDEFPQIVVGHPPARRVR